MRRRYLALLALIVSLPTLFLTSTCILGNVVRQTKQSFQLNLTAKTLEIINIDGNVSLSEDQNRIYWNPHSVGSMSTSSWKIAFNNETEMHLQTAPNEAGHIAAGAWWTTSFKCTEKLQLYNSEPVRLIATFRTNIIAVNCHSGDEWLRIAIACAIQRSNGLVLYTEMDLWDSPTVLACPFGDIMLGRNTVYRGGDVVEFKFDQAPENEWKDYLLDLTDQINKAWLLKPGDVLESVYFVVEAAGAVTATVKVDDLWIARLD